MLYATPTPHGAGILLSGDDRDLESFHETIHYLTRGVPLGGEFDNLVLGLAYDVRKAMENQREAVPVQTEFGDKLHYKGVRILWPTFLLQLALLRRAAAFHPTTREIQSNIFRAESCTESSLIEYDRETGRRVMDWYERFNGLPTGYAHQYVEVVDKEFIVHSSNGKNRFRNLPNVLLMLDPLSDEYTEFEYEIKSKGAEIPHPYKELRVEIDFPEFDW
jgi:hypothetical protein